jgi:hypothetical protein
VLLALNPHLDTFDPTLLALKRYTPGRTGYVKLGSERRDPDSLNTFITSIVGPL